MLKFAFRNLLSRPMRSLLSLLGLTVAIAGMVGLFSVAHGLDRTVSITFGSIPGLVAMQPGAPIPLFSTLPADWEDEIARLPGVATVNAEVWQRVNMIEGKSVLSPPRFLFGTDVATRVELRHCIYREAVVAGRFLALEDRGTFNVLVSRQIAEEFGKGVGDVLRVNGRDMTIVGIYHTGSLLLDISVILDIGQVRALTRFDPGSVSAYYIEQTGEVGDDELIARIHETFRGRTVDPWRPSVADLDGREPGAVLVDIFQNLFRELRDSERSPEGGPETPDEAGPDQDGVADRPRGTREDASGGGGKINGQKADGPDRSPPPVGEVPIEVRGADQWSERFDKFSEDLNLFLTLMTGIGVTIAVLSIVNTMLMSVSERIIEFGILKANGWSRLDVLRLVTFESAALGVGGGVLGSAVGWGATHVVNWYWPERVDLYAGPGLLLFSVAFSTALGVLGGRYPAVWAMRMMPMDAMRRG